MLARKKYDLSKFKGASIKSVVIRETNGADEETAASLAKSKGGSVTGTEELVRLSIAEVDGSPVDQPYGGFDRWNSRTRSFVLSAWRELNTVDLEEAADFLKGGEILPDSPIDGR